MQGVIGLFLNILPIRARLAEEASFTTALRQTHQTVLEAFNHAALPFEQIIELAVKDRDSGTKPLHEIMFVFAEENAPLLNLGNARVSPLPVETRTSKNDLTLSIRAAGGAWECRFEYAADMLEAETVTRMAGHFIQLLRSIVAAPDQAISRLNLIPEEERNRLLVEWNQTKRDYPQDRCVQELFEKQVERSPDSVALLVETTTLTYRELNTRANRIAHCLRNMGVRLGTLVGLGLERSADMVAGLLGILKAGAAYVPLDPCYPTERLAFLIKDSGIKVVLTQPSLEALFTKSAAPRVVTFNDISDVVATDSNPPLLNQPSDLSYVIYTSGSTGSPKGVAIEHRNVVSFLHWVKDTFSAEELSGVLALTSICFDLSVLGRLAGAAK